MMRLIVLTGASGSGKTAIADEIETSRPGLAEVFRFDRIGVPKGWGSGEAWQRAMTLTWIARIAALRGSDRPVLFEGQMRLAFVQEGLKSAGIADSRLILLDCDDATRMHRLVAHRKQPELANPTMMNWAALLRREAQAGGYEVLDTSKLPLQEAVEYVCARLRGQL
jgi:RNase adaptor protein for sRNA GlmZ degradation